MRAGTYVGVWLLLAAGACAPSDQLVPCGDKLCPAGSVCTPGGCANHADVEACAGLADGASCQAATGGIGTCVGGACQTGLCGNGLVDPGEVCDGEAGVDVAAGQTCSGDCQHVYACGNGVVDPGEQCDSGNHNPDDGCDACHLSAWSATSLLGGNLLAATLSLNQPVAVAADPAGSVYICEYALSRILRVDSSGVITVIAGNAQASGFFGDGGPATNAVLSFPFGVAVDGLGNVFIADNGNNRVRRVDTAGIITTVAGNGTSTSSGDGGPATSGGFNLSSIALDGLGNLYIADANHRIRKVDPSGTITTIAGTGVRGFTGDGGPATSAELDDPFALVVDAAGNIYFSDEGNYRIRRIDPTGTITTIAGTGAGGLSGDGGPATSATISRPLGITVDAADNVYFADADNARVRRVDTGGVITTVAGSVYGFGGDGGPATSSKLGFPSGVAFDPTGAMYIADWDNDRVRRVDAGTITTFSGNGVQGDLGDGGAASSGMFFVPVAVTIAPSGDILVSDNSTARVRRIDAMGLISTFAGSGNFNTGPGDGGPATKATLVVPVGIAFDAIGDLFIADDLAIRRVDTSGTITTFASVPTPAGIAFDAANNLYVAAPGSNNVLAIDPAGTVTTFAGTSTAGFGGDKKAATAALLSSPQGVAVDAAGNVYIADEGNQRVRRVDNKGIITTFAGGGTATGDGGLATNAVLGAPIAVAVDATGAVYISDNSTNKIRKVDAAGVITTVAGTGVDGYDGDGGLATAAQLDGPWGIAVDAQGRLYIADGTASNLVPRVRRVDAAGKISTIAGPVDPPGTGPVALARLSDPRAFVVTPSMTVVAGGSLGVLETLSGGRLTAVAGRYPQTTATAALARYRDQNFGTVAGVAYDEAAGVVYISEATANRLHAVTIVDPANPLSWTIAPLANSAGTAGFSDGAAATAKFRGPTGLYLDAAAHQLYVADTGNHVVREIDLSGGIGAATVRTIAGTPATLGFYGDGGSATAALLYAPAAITRCSNGDVFVADTGNNRIRRIEAGTGTITTVLGDGSAASSGQGRPATHHPVDHPLGLACDAAGNVFATSRTTVRVLPASDSGVVDGTGDALTIYGLPPRDTFPASVTRCLSGIATIDATTVQVVDQCTGLLVELRRTRSP